MQCCWLTSVREVRYTDCQDVVTHNKHLLMTLNDDDLQSPCSFTPATQPPPHAEFYQMSRLVTGLVIYPIICVVGLTGNSLALVVFSRPSMTTSYNVLLAALAANDLIKLLNDLLYFVHVVLLGTDPPSAYRLLVHVYSASHYVFNQVLNLCCPHYAATDVFISGFVVIDDVVLKCNLIDLTKNG